MSESSNWHDVSAKVVARTTESRNLFIIVCVKLLCCFYLIVIARAVRLVAISLIFVLMATNGIEWHSLTMFAEWQRMTKKLSALAIKQLQTALSLNVIKGASPNAIIVVPAITSSNSLIINEIPPPENRGGVFVIPL